MKTVKRILSLLCCFALASLVLTVYATDDVSSEILPEPPAPSQSESSEIEVSSEPDISSEPVSSEEEPVPESSDVAVSSKQPASSQPDKQSEPDKPSSAVTDSDNGSRGTAILVFCYIITALIGVCLVGFIIANVCIPIANKKRELSRMMQNEPFEEGYDLGEHAPKRKNENRRPRGRM